MDTLLCYLALLALCLFFASLSGVNSAAAPLLAISSAMLWFTLTGVLGVLVPAAWVFYLLCGALGVLALLRRRSLAFWRRQLSPGLVLFALLGLVLMVWLGLRQPVFAEWDEFTFWGPAVKQMKLTGRLYTTADFGWFWSTTQSPALPAFSWFAQFFGSTFAPWKVFWAYDLVMLACVAALTAPFGWRRWRTALPLAVAGLLTPFFFSVLYHTTYLNTTWMSAYADLPAGMLFGGALALYFSVRQAGRGALWQAAPPLAALALVKDGNVFLIALAAAGVMAVDTLLYGRAGSPVPPAGALEAAKTTPAHAQRGPRLRRLAAALGLFAAPIAFYALWQGHAAWANAQNLQTGGDATSMSPFTALLLTLRELFGLAPRSAEFTGAAQNLWQAFVGHPAAGAAGRVSMVGSALATCLVILLLCALGMVLAGGARMRRRMALAGGLLLAGFAGYHLVLLAFYAHIYDSAGSAAVPDYARYLQSYLAGWLLLALFAVALGAKQLGAKRRLTNAAMLVLACLLLGRSAVLIRPGYSVVDYAPVLQDSRRAEEAAVARLAAQLPEGARVLYVRQAAEDDGSWFRIHYYLLPAVLDYSFTGGLALPPAGETAAATGWDETADPLQQLAAHMEENHIDYMLVAQLDEAFLSTFGPLFEQPPDLNLATPALYARGAGGRFVPAP